MTRIERGARVESRLAPAAALASLALAAATASCRAKQETPFFASLTPCHLTNDSAEVVDMVCGTLEVYEDRVKQSGRKLDIAVAVLKAPGRHRSPDALFFLAGGPGQSALDLYPSVHWAFAGIDVNRDIVLVDQRGTGRSGRLACPETDVLGTNADPAEAAAAASHCRERLEKSADLTKYTTALAADDLDNVRAALGYDTIDLYGISYGTRAALEYLRRHEAHVRAVVLDGVAPPDWTLGSTFGSAGQRALDGIFARCAHDPACNAGFPGLAGNLTKLLADHEEPEMRTVADPTSGKTESVRVSRESIAGTLHGLTYQSDTAALIPLLVHSAATTGELGPIAAQSLMLNDALKIDIGEHLAVLCSEDVPFFDMDAIHRDGAGSYIGDVVARRYVELCKGWPRAAVSPADRAPVTSTVPVLLLSGELDPVTPPSNAEHAAATLAHAKTITVPGEGHGALLRGCTRTVVADFLDNPSAPLDAACVKKTKPLRFFTRFAGPEP